MEPSVILSLPPKCLCYRLLTGLVYVLIFLRCKIFLNINVKILVFPTRRRVYIDFSEKKHASFAWDFVSRLDNFPIVL